MNNKNNNVDVAYNVQTTLDAKHKLICDFEVITKPNDLGQLYPMSLRANRSLKQIHSTSLPIKVTIKQVVWKRALKMSSGLMLASRSEQTGPVMKSISPTDSIMTGKKIFIYVLPEPTWLKTEPVKTTMDYSYAMIIATR